MNLFKNRKGNPEEIEEVAELTEVETKENEEMHKKSRKRRTAIGVGIGACAVALLAILAKKGGSDSSFAIETDFSDESSDEDGDLESIQSNPETETDEETKE